MAFAAFGMRCAFHLLQPIMGRKALQHEKRRRFLKNVDGAERAERGKRRRGAAGAGKDDAERRGAFVPRGSDGDKRRGHDRREVGRGVSGPWQGSRRRPASGLRFPPSSLASGLPPGFSPSRSARGAMSRTARGVLRFLFRFSGVARASRGERSGRNVMDSIAFSENLG